MIELRLNFSAGDGQSNHLLGTRERFCETAQTEMVKNEWAEHIYRLD